MSSTEQHLHVEYVTDPAAAMSSLAGTDRFGEYVMYEQPGEWVFAADPLGSVELDAGELRTVWAGETIARAWTGSPADAIDTALAELPLDGRNAFGWIGFEFCAYSLEATAHLNQRTPLAHLMIPRIEVRISAGSVRISGATPAEAREMMGLAPLRLGSPA